MAGKGKVQRLRQVIDRMAADGLSRREIADALGVSVGSVAQFVPARQSRATAIAALAAQGLSRVQIVGALGVSYTYVARQGVPPSQSHRRAFSCEMCGCSLNVKRRTYCDPCLDQRRHRPRRPPRPCAVCGQLFKARKRITQTCSDRCRCALIGITKGQMTQAKRLMEQQRKQERQMLALLERQRRAQQQAARKAAAAEHRKAMHAAAAKRRPEVLRLAKSRRKQRERDALQRQYLIKLLGLPAEVARPDLLDMKREQITIRRLARQLKEEASK